jgi:hypothetical protein
MSHPWYIEVSPGLPTIVTTVRIRGQRPVVRSAFFGVPAERLDLAADALVVGVADRDDGREQQ